MPFGLQGWANSAGIVSAMCDVIATGSDTFQAFYERRRTAPDIMQRAATLEQAMSTYGDEELEAISQRLQACRDRLIAEGSGAERKRCLCIVLGDVKDGNGGTIPFDDWKKTYETLGCGS